jgi:acyl carrier protein
MSRKQQLTADHSFITQITLLHLKTQTTDEKLATIFKEVQQLQQHIPCLIGVTTGENQSTYHRGFTHGIILHFVDEVHLRDAMTHKNYLKVQEQVSRLCEQVITFEVPETLHLPLPTQEEPPEQKISTPKQQRKSARTVAVPEPPTPEEREQALQREHILTRMQAYERQVKEIDPRLKRIVLDQLGVEESEIVPHASLVEDLNADSLDLVEYIMSVEAVFHIQISDEDAERLTTLAETQAYLQANNCL